MDIFHSSKDYYHANILNWGHTNINTHKISQKPTSETQRIFQGLCSCVCHPITEKSPYSAIALCARAHIGRVTYRLTSREQGIRLTFAWEERAGYWS